MKPNRSTAMYTVSCITEQKRPLETRDVGIQLGAAFRGKRLVGNPSKLDGRIAQPNRSCGRADYRSSQVVMQASKGPHGNGVIISNAMSPISHMEQGSHLFSSSWLLARFWSCSLERTVRAECQHNPGFLKEVRQEAVTLALSYRHPSACSDIFRIQQLTMLLVVPRTKTQERLI